MEGIRRTDQTYQHLLVVVEAQTRSLDARSLQDTLRQENQKIVDAIRSSQQQATLEHELADTRCYQRAFGSNSSYASFKERVPLRVPGTCEWVLNHQNFQHWHYQDRSSILWVSANPGYGKSVLSRFLVNEALVQRADNVCYFFFKDDNEPKKTVEQAMCAVLHQLFESQPQLLEHAKQAVERNQEKSLQQGLHRLWEIFLDSARDDTTGSVICVLDALGECEFVGAERLNTMIGPILRGNYDELCEGSLDQDSCHEPALR